MPTRVSFISIPDNHILSRERSNCNFKMIMQFPDEVSFDLQNISDFMLVFKTQDNLEQSYYFEFETFCEIF